MHAEDPHARPEPEPEPAPDDAAPTGQALERRVVHEVIHALPAAEVRAAMVSHQALLQEILDPSDWQGPPNAKDSFVKKSGWRKVALAYNLGMGRVGEEVERDEEGGPLRASYTAWSEAPNGRRVEATGHCARGESRFAREGGRQKLENDLRATAETRAKNRAISDLIGMGKVSAEEAAAGTGDAAGPPFGPEADDALFEKALGAVAFLFDLGNGPDAEAATIVIGKVTADTGKGEDAYLPKIAARAFLWAAAEMKARLPAPVEAQVVPPAAPEPAPAAAPASAEPAEQPPEAEEVDGEITAEEQQRDADIRF